MAMVGVLCVKSCREKMHEVDAHSIIKRSGDDNHVVCYRCDLCSAARGSPNMHFHSTSDESPSYKLHRISHCSSANAGDVMITVDESTARMEDGGW